MQEQFLNVHAVYGPEGVSNNTRKNIAKGKQQDIANHPSHCYFVFSQNTVQAHIKNLPYPF